MSQGCLRALWKIDLNMSNKPPLNIVKNKPLVLLIIHTERLLSFIFKREKVPFNPAD